MFGHLGRKNVLPNRWAHTLTSEMSFEKADRWWMVRLIIVTLDGLHDVSNDVRVNFLLQPSYSNPLE